MKRKGMSTVAIVVLGLLGVALIGSFAFMATQLSQAPREEVEADGEWDEIFTPDEVAGTDLSITETSIEEDGDYNFGSLAYDIDGTDGSTHTVAYGVEVDGNFLEDAEIFGELHSDVSTSEAVIRDAYIVPHEEGLNLDSSDAKYSAEVETEQDEFEFDISKLDDGEYVLVVELRSIDTVDNIDPGDGLIDYEFDASTDDDVDAFTGNVTNA